MATVSDNYAFVLPDGDESIDIDAINENMKKIDTLLSTAYIKSFSTPTIDITSGDNLDDYTDAGVYKAKNAATAGSLLNCPVTDGFRLEVRYISDATRRIQTIYPNNVSGYFYMRNYTATGWGGWYRYGGEPVGSVTPAEAVAAETE